MLFVSPARVDMPKSAGIAQVTKDLFDLLEPLETEDRQRAITAVQTLFGDAPGTPILRAVSPVTSGPPTPASRLGAPSNAQSFFDEKDPQSKNEEYAVAARYHELTSGAHTHSREELESVFSAARRDFNGSKYRRDIDNAKRSGYFNRGDGNTLSAHGQKYVDALPDREAAKAAAKPRTFRRKARKTRGKSASAK